MLTIQDINNALIFLNRVDIKGNEAMPMTDLQIKLQSMRQEIQQAQEPAPPADPPPPPPKPPQAKEKEGKTEH